MTITNNTEASLVDSIKFYFPHFLNPNKVNSVLRNFITVFAYIFKLNTDQLNQMFVNTFIQEAEGDILTDLIMDISGIKRKNDETDEDYRARYIKYCYEYNITNNSVNNIVNDITGQFPSKIVEGNSRGFYWGTPNNQATGSVIDTRYYYNDVGVYTPLWGTEGEKAWIAYIFLKEIPSQEILNELCDVIERVRMIGTTIYLVLPQVSDIIFEWENLTGSGNFEVFDGVLTNEGIITNDGTLFEYLLTNQNNPIDDFSGNDNKAIIQDLVDEESIFTWLIEDLLFSDLTSNNNDGILLSIAYTDYILESIFTYLISNQNNPIDDSSLNNNDALIETIPDPSILFEWELEGV